MEMMAVDDSRWVVTNIIVLVSCANLPVRMLEIKENQIHGSDPVRWPDLRRMSFNVNLHNRAR